MARAKGILVPLVILVTCTACATNHQYARFDPGRDILPLDVFYVEIPIQDRGNLGQLIVDNLTARGVLATAGPEDSVPGKATILLTYEGRWSWDITNFLIEMSITLRNPSTREAFAIGSSYHTSMTRLNPVEMIDEIISNLIEADKKPDGLVEIYESGAL